MSDDLIDRTLRLLHKVGRHTHASEEMEALRTAKIALHFIQSIGESHGFEDYLEKFDVEGSPSPRYAFATREEAEHWLKNHPTPPHGAMVAIGGVLHCVGFSRESGLRVLMRIPAVEEQR